MDDRQSERGDPSDTELLIRCRRGDANAWDTLVRRYESLVFGCARAGGLPEADAADVTQSVFVALIDAGLAIRDDERLGSWLLTVAQRQVWRTRRELERQRLEPLPTQSEQTLEDWEQMAVLHDALTALASPCRELIHALYFDAGRPTYGAVARRFGLAVGSIGPKRARCLHHLRSLIGEQ